MTGNRLTTVFEVVTVDGTYRHRPPARVVNAAMHHALHVVDLITEIVDEVARHPDFDWPPLPSQQLADLAAMARTCKLFYEPAMNALWKVIHTQFHLIQWLPYWQFIYHSQWEVGLILATFL